MKNHDPLGDRMKVYEAAEAARKCMPLIPICARLDGKCFSKYTKDLKRPYDYAFTRIMVTVTKWLVEETCAVVGYTQSDEISLIFYSPSFESQVFFDGKIQKMVSVLASMATAKFNELAQRLPKNRRVTDVGIVDDPRDLAFFDCRVWQVPDLIEATNAILWREFDAAKNSISMAARTVYSHKELMNKDCSEMQEMLFQKGINWNDYPPFFKRGTYVRRSKVMKELEPEILAKIPEDKRPTGPIERNVVEELPLPPLSKVQNRVLVIFNGDVPEFERGVGDGFVREMCKEWKRRISFISSISEMIKDPAFKAMISIGKTAVPIIVDEMKKDSDNASLFLALREIMNVFVPVVEDERGKFDIIAAKWIAKAEEWLVGQAI